MLPATQSRCPVYSGAQHLRFPFKGEGSSGSQVSDPFEAKSFVRGRKIGPPGAPGKVFDFKCASCGHARHCAEAQLFAYGLGRKEGWGTIAFPAYGGIEDLASSFGVGICTPLIVYSVSCACRRVSRDLCFCVGCPKATGRTA